MRKLKYVKLFENFSYITEGLKSYLENPEYLMRMAMDMNIPPNRLVGEGRPFPAVDLSDEDKATRTWIDGYFYKIKDYLGQNMIVLISPEPRWNKQFDLGMKIERNPGRDIKLPFGFEPNKGFKTFFLEIKNRNNNSMIQIAINEEKNEVKFFQDNSGGSQLFFSPDSIESLFDVFSLVAKNFMSFDLDVKKLSEDLFTALSKPTNDYNNSAQKDIESIKQFYLR